MLISRYSKVLFIMSGLAFAVAFLSTRPNWAIVAFTILISGLPGLKPQKPACILSGIALLLTILAAVAALSRFQLLWAFILALALTVAAMLTGAVVVYRESRKPVGGRVAD